MIFVWSGYGFVTIFIVWMSLLIGAILEFVLPQGVAIGVGLLLAAASNQYLTDWLSHPSRQQEVQDVKTGQRVVIQDSSSVLFIPIRYWTHVIGIAAFVAFGLDINSKL